MWYYVRIIRGGVTLYVTSPEYGVFTLSPEKAHLYLWDTEQDASSDQRWRHLIEEGDRVEYVRRYVV